MDIFDCETVIDVLQLWAEKIDGGKRGTISSLAKISGCHASYMAQVFRQQSTLGLEQAQRLGNYFHLDQNMFAYFFDLVQHEKAGTQELKAHFKESSLRRRETQKELSQVWNQEEEYPRARRRRYFENWILQLVHVYLQTQGRASPEEISKANYISLDETKRVLEVLRDLELATESNKQWESSKNFLHLEKGDPSEKMFHVSWRSFVMSKLLLDRSLSSLREPHQAFHFSSLISIDQETATAIHKLLLQNLTSIRSKAQAAESREIYFLGIDLRMILPESI